MFADQVALSFERLTPSLTNFDNSWSSFGKVYKDLFVGGSSEGKEREREVIVLDDDEEEEEEDEVQVEAVPKEIEDEEDVSSTLLLLPF